VFRSRYTLVLLLTGAGWLLAAQSTPTRAGSSIDNQQLEAGKKVFVANCSGCHGLDATGGDRAPGISSGSEAAKMGDDELKRTVRDGIAGAGMPPFASMGNAQIASVVSYLLELQGKAGSEKMPGDSHRGAALFFGKARCAECHMAEGNGGFLASDLTGYAENRSARELRRAITSPGSNRDEHTKQAVVRTADGHVYHGMVRQEDNFSLGLLTSDGKFLLFQKGDLASVSFDRKSPMPTDYGKTLSGAELDDLVSYLMQLRKKVDPAASQRASRGGWEDE
jgi:cytochrome c oxidase cbb3-type subunit 3